MDWKHSHTMAPRESRALRRCISIFSKTASCHQSTILCGSSHLPVLTIACRYREDWHTFAPRAGETQAEYKARLGHIFTFSKTASRHQRITYPSYFASAAPKPVRFCCALLLRADLQAVKQTQQLPYSHAQTSEVNEQPLTGSGRLDSTLQPCMLLSESRSPCLRALRSSASDNAVLR